ncbi:MAG TPA: MFS transporter [Xanthobacteraceae bacterium]|nr:MFS transporter [Xanthobacteraceae bacterium]
MPTKIIIPLIVACALFMENLDSTVISTALPAISVDLHQDPIALKLALTSYLLTLAVFIPISGWMADRFGPRTVFRLAILVFTIGSLLCGFSTSLLDFVIYRIIQGMGGAMMTPVGRLVVLRLIPKHEYVSAFAWLVIPALIGPLIGPPLGGFITTYFSWRWIFWINIPIGILGIALATRYIENMPVESVPPLDLKGFVLSGVGLAGLAFGFTTIGQAFMPVSISLAMLALGAAVTFAYVLHARVTPYPPLDLKLLSVDTFRASVVGGALFRIGIGSLPFLLPLLFQIGFGLSPLQSGLLTFAGAIGAMTMRMSVAPILRRFGIKRVLLINTFVASGFIAACGLFRPESPYWLILLVLLIGGFFRSLQFSSLNSLAFADIGNSDMSKATSFTSVAQQLSITAGIAIGALTLEAARYLRGDILLTPADFSWAFFAVALFSMSSIFMLIPLPIDAGASLTAQPPPEAPPAESGKV